MWLARNYSVRLHDFTTGAPFAPSFILCITPSAPGAAPLQYFLDCRPAHLRELYRHRAATLHALQGAAEEAFANTLFTRPGIIGHALYSPEDIENFISELLNI
jgi:hypothetical protein